MAMHYTISSEKTACGRAATSANATSKTADVSCKTCCKSEAFGSVAPVAAKVPASAAQVPAPVAKTVSTPTAEPAAPAAKSNLAQATDPESIHAATAVAFKEWRTQLNTKDRLPRGKYFARLGHPVSKGQRRVAA